ncbi:MAG: TolC family protein [Alphaproteobacteria bacterium]|nr:TolC family protein [Alphaproteobacteria bacterium]MCW5741357.1 TolC family protein [Alphaproteobacteria bacterium]
MRRVLTIGVLLLAAACAEFSPDGGMSMVSTTVRDKLGGEAVKINSAADAERVRTRVDALLAQPLTPDSAVQIALLNNRNLQAAYNDLGLNEIAGVEASLPPNPRISLSRLARTGAVEWEFQLLGNILALATLPARRQIARQRFAQAQQAAVESTYRLALETRRAWINAVAAQTVVGYLEQSRMAADATADLMRKLGETGGATRIEQARAAAAYAELSAQLAHARMRARQDREALVRLLGLWGAQDIRLPARLPALPARLEPIDNVEAEAIRSRVDVAMARQELAILARSVDLAEATRFISLLELSGIVETERDDDGRKTRGGFELELEIPIFDGGQVKLRRERESYMRAVNRLAARAAAARSEARSAYHTWRASHEIAAQYQNRVLPLRRVISQETLLRYNGMLADVFELLVETRERVASNVAAIEARRAFLLAEIDLRAAVIGGGPSAFPISSPIAAPAVNAGGGH